MPEFAGGGINLLDDRLRAAAQMDCLAASILGRFLALDPAVALQSMQDAGKGRLFNPDQGGQLALSERGLGRGQVYQSHPFTLAQAEWAEAFVEAVAPGAGGAGQAHADFFEVVFDCGHWLAC